MSSNSHKILILGGGVAGLTTAMALTQFAPAHSIPSIEVFEVRSKPGTVGGAINLTPNALRLLDFLGVLAVIRERQYGIEVNSIEVFSIYHTSRLAESSFMGPDNRGFGNPPFKALRITRASLMEALCEAVSRVPNVNFQCGKRATQINENNSGVQIFFDDGTTVDGDLLIGCDGVHSFTRNSHVEPERRQVYTGVANAFGFVPLQKNQLVHFEGSALNFSRRGMLLTSYYEHSKTSAYVGAIIEVKDVGSRDGWKTIGSDSDAVRADIRERFQHAVHPAVNTFINDAEDWFMWPIYMLPAGGRWATDRTILIGDAAHGMPPQGEATGIVLEDGILLARCLSQKQGSIKDAFNAYERLRRDRINQAFKESQSVISSVKDIGHVGHTLKTYIIPIFLWYSRKGREAHFIEDVTTSPLGMVETSIEEAPSSSLLPLRPSAMSVYFSKLFEVIVARTRAVLLRKESHQE
ncbi:MAG: hypothetical protein Q9227_004296 [Pyrenula ochraceoflavens]